MSSSIWAVIPAAGSGRRMAAEVPKQYLLVNGVPILEHTLSALLACPDIRGLVVVWIRVIDVPILSKAFLIRGYSEQREAVSEQIQCYLAFRPSRRMRAPMTGCSSTMRRVPVFRFQYCDS